MSDYLNRDIYNLQGDKNTLEKNLKIQVQKRNKKMLYYNSKHCHINIMQIYSSAVSLTINFVLYIEGVW